MMEPNKYLIEIHKIVIEWLKFAETKNAALLTGNLVVIFGVSKIEVFSSAPVCSWVWYYYLSIVVFCGLSALCCMLSIIPQIKMPWFRSKDKSNAIDNLVFFGTIADYSPESYAEKLQETLGTKFNPIEMSFAGQIVINAKIARRKYKSFKVAAWLTLSAFLTPVVGGLLMVIREE